MALYKVTLVYQGSISYTIDAASSGEAEQIARDRWSKRKAGDPGGEHLEAVLEPVEVGDSS